MNIPLFAAKASLCPCGRDGDGTAVNVLVFVVLLALAVTGALAWGGAPERLMGLMLGAAALATMATFGRIAPQH